MEQNSSSTPNLRYPAWQYEYHAALLEVDPMKMLERVHVAEAAIVKRLQELAQDSPGLGHKAEEDAIADALSALRTLKRDKLDFPDWEKT